MILLAAGAALLIGYAVFTHSPRKEEIRIDPSAAPTGSASSLPAIPKSAFDGASGHASGKVPDWVPIYPGTTPEGISQQQAGIENYLSFTLSPKSGHCRDYYDFYRAKLNEAGFRVIADSIDELGGNCTGGMRGEGPGHSRSINVSIATTASGDKISIDVVQRDKTGTGQSGQISGPVKLPDWVPGYPGATPESMNSFGYELEKRIAYTFRSTDDPAKVLTWFARKLTEAGVHITASYTGSHGGFVHTNTADGRRMFNVEAAAPGTAPIFHVELREIKDGQ